MAVKARTWTTVDKEIAGILATEKDARKLSYRDIAKMTGMKHMRVSDIIHMVNGTPTVVEFLSICETFGLDPAVTLRRIIADAERLAQDPEIQAESVSPAGERLPVLSVSPADIVPSADDDAPLSNEEIMAMAANKDPNRGLEAETPRD